jgi:hypothetical protein
VGGVDVTVHAHIFANGVSGSGDDSRKLLSSVSRKRRRRANVKSSWRRQW